MKFNLNKKKNKNKKKRKRTQFTSQHYSHHCHSWMISKRHHFHSLLSLHYQRSSFSCACDLKSQFFWSSWSSLFERSSIFYFFSFLFIFSFVAIAFSASTLIFVTSTKFEVSSLSDRRSFAFSSFISSTKRDQSRCVR